MKLLLLRHAVAEDRATFAASGKEDRLRPLTEEGRKKMRRIGDALAGLLPELALIATSPYTRARESAEILARAFPERPVLSEIAELAPAGVLAGAAQVPAGAEVAADSSPASATSRTSRSSPAGC